MKLTIKFPVLFFGVLMLTNIANAESPREQLKQMVEQLQQSPTNNALREKIIKMARKIKPAPAVPEEAEKFEGRAQFAFKNAKSPADFLDAANEYEKAIAAAPWVPGYYADLCTIYEKAEKYAEAKKSCEFFLASSPSAQDASDVRKRIAGLVFAMEKANSPEARAAQEKARQDAFLRSLDGARFVKRWGDPTNAEFETIAEIHGNTLVKKTLLTSAIPEYLRGMNTFVGDRKEDDLSFRLENGEFVGVIHHKVPWYKNDKFDRYEEFDERYVATVSPDGQLLTIKSDQGKGTGIYTEVDRIRRQ